MAYQIKRVKIAKQSLKKTKKPSHYQNSNSLLGFITYYIEFLKVILKRKFALNPFKLL